MPYREPYEVALQAWGQSILSEFDSDPLWPGHVVSLIFSDQANAKVTKPFATLLVLGHALDGEPAKATEYLPGPDEIRQDVIGRYSGTASVQIFGPKHETMARALVLSLDEPPTRDANRAAGLVVAYASTAPRRLSIDTNGVVEDRTIIEFRFRFSAIRSYQTPEFIDTFIQTPNIG